MKKVLYLMIFLLIFKNTQAQYHITGVTVTTVSCTSMASEVKINTYAPGLIILTHYNNDTPVTSTVNNGGSYGFANVYIPTNLSGQFSYKHVLYNGSVAVDSIIQSYESIYCNTMTIKSFVDVTGTGIFNPAVDPLNTMALNLQVSKNGTAVENISITSGTYFSYTGVPGDIYAFKIISLPPGVNVTTPSTGILYDTIKSYGSSYPVKYFGFHCTGTPGFDLGMNIVNSFTRGQHMGRYIYPFNTTCNPTSGVLTVNFSPKYVYVGEANPAPSSASGNSLTWDLSGLTSMSISGIYFRTLLSGKNLKG
jgi:hypothetical protein